MSTIANVVLPNEAAVNVTFIPVVGYQGKKQGAVWTATSGYIAPMEYPRIELNQARTTNRSTHTDFKISVPYVVNDPAKGPTLVCTAHYSRSAGFIIPDNCPSAVASRLYSFVKAFTALTLVQNAVLGNDLPR